MFLVINVYDFELQNWKKIAICVKIYLNYFLLYDYKEIFLKMYSWWMVYGSLQIMVIWPLLQIWRNCDGSFSFH